MSMRSFPDRMRHAVLFEVLALLVFPPLAAWVFGFPMTAMGVIGIVSATVATVWNFLFNLGFDHALLRLSGRTQKRGLERIVHALLFEGGLIVLLVPVVAWYLDITVWQALKMDIAIVGFYLVYAYGFNLAYDRVFPVAPRRALATRGG